MIGLIFPQYIAGTIWEDLFEYFLEPCCADTVQWEPKRCVAPADQLLFRDNVGILNKFAAVIVRAARLEKLLHFSLGSGILDHLAFLFCDYTRQFTNISEMMVVVQTALHFRERIHAKLLQSIRSGFIHHDLHKGEENNQLKVHLLHLRSLEYHPTAHDCSDLE